MKVYYCRWCVWFRTPADVIGRAIAKLHVRRHYIDTLTVPRPEPPRSP